MKNKNKGVLLIILMYVILRFLSFVLCSKFNICLDQYTAIMLIALAIIPYVELKTMDLNSTIRSLKIFSPFLVGHFVISPLFKEMCQNEIICIQEKYMWLSYLVLALGLVLLVPNRKNPSLEKRWNSFSKSKVRAYIVKTYHATFIALFLTSVLAAFFI